jgi:uncharacterized membrane protein (UPF0127 family)
MLYPQHPRKPSRAVRWSVAAGLLPLLLLTASRAPLADTLRLGEHTLTVELASTPDQWYRGLMHREHLGDDEGMLFVYPDSQPRSFWMKNTFIPLSVGLFDADRRLVEILHLDPPRSVMQVTLPVTVSQRPARYALEVRQGWFADHAIAVGAVFELQHD